MKGGTEPMQVRPYIYVECLTPYLILAVIVAWVLKR